MKLPLRKRSTSQREHAMSHLARNSQQAEDPHSFFSSGLKQQVRFPVPNYAILSLVCVIEARKGFCLP